MLTAATKTTVGTGGLAGARGRVGGAGAEDTFFGALDGGFAVDGGPGTHAGRRGSGVVVSAGSLEMGRSEKSGCQGCPMALYGGTTYGGRESSGEDERGKACQHPPFPGPLVSLKHSDAAPGERARFKKKKKSTKSRKGITATACSHTRSSRVSKSSSTCLKGTVGGGDRHPTTRRRNQDGRHRRREEAPTLQR
ncbi:uncharacterized protein LY79DRAFT_259718 [Colletotrichum navitas]|uniref:Uncharacterized protein n=1 Tax=Colletotrichum navitas TaxID=681940 RepID=A0AAD8PX87_9PEZI|nr:uncharacterized protein LY79DRAFT_259718 [Colletotrichum navitas]KAK1585751.1 hypothetical protein LY79DRAFT_259718 [Colletotrichum navitas]